MKIIENKLDIPLKGAKFATGNRPDGLAKFLNYVNLSLIIGLPASGKSSLIKTLLNGTKEHRLYNNIFHSVYYISPSMTMSLNLPDEKIIQLTDTEPLDAIIEQIIENERDIGEPDEHHHVCVICDDCVAEINTNKQAMRTFKKACFNGRHILGKHSSLQTFLVTQKVKAVPLTIRSQANQVFFFDSTKAEKEVIRDEFLPLDRNAANLIFDHIFSEPHNFMFINLHLPKKERIFKNFNQLEIVKE